MTQYARPTSRSFTRSSFFASWITFGSWPSTNRLQNVLSRGIPSPLLTVTDDEHYFSF
jgi:hypothetical protein